MTPLDAEQHIQIGERVVERSGKAMFRVTKTIADLCRQEGLDLDQTRVLIAQIFLAQGTWHAVMAGIDRERFIRRLAELFDQEADQPATTTTTTTPETPETRH